MTQSPLISVHMVYMKFIMVAVTHTEPGALAGLAVRTGRRRSGRLPGCL